MVFFSRFLFLTFISRPPRAVTHGGEWGPKQAPGRKKKHLEKALSPGDRARGKMAQARKVTFGVGTGGVGPVGPDFCFNRVPVCQYKWALQCGGNFFLGTSWSGLEVTHGPGEVLGRGKKRAIRLARIVQQQPPWNRVHERRKGPVTSSRTTSTRAGS